VRLFIIAHGGLEDVTQYVAKILKLKLVQQRKWVDIPKEGNNPVYKIAELLAKTVGKPKQAFKDLY